MIGITKTLKKANQARRLGVPQNTQNQSKRVANVCYDWVQHWLQIPCVEKEENNTN